MALVDELAEGSGIAFDSDALIYYVEEHAQYLPILEPVIDAVASGRFQAHVSVVSLIEVLVRPLREDRADLANAYREILMHSAGTELHPVDARVAERAADLRARFRLAAPDAIIAATALVVRATALITNNADDYRRVEGLRVLAINDFV